MHTPPLCSPTFSLSLSLCVSVCMCEGMTPVCVHSSLIVVGGPLVMTSRAVYVLYNVTQLYVLQCFRQ